MKYKVQFQTGEGALVSQTNFPNYSTRKAAAKRAKKMGYSSLVEFHPLNGHTVNLTHYLPK